MASTDKIDLYKQHKDQYVVAKKPVLVTMDEATYLTICGRGAPGGPEFTDKVGSLYGVAFHGRHHEIYLSDPRRIVPEKLKTILRLPVRKKKG